MKIKVMGMDPSMSNWGFATAELDLTDLTFSTPELMLVETKAGKDKRVRKNSDDLERAQLISAELQERLQDDIQLCFVEVPHGSQSARAMASYGICIGILSTIDVPMIQLSEQQLKLSTVGHKTATKQEMIDWATSLHPESNWLLRGQKYLAKNEHLADAVGALYAGVESAEFNSIRSTLTRLLAA